MTSLDIRPVQPLDYDSWLVLWQGYLDFYQHPLPPEVTELTWARFLNPAEPMFALVAQRDDRLLGMATYVLHRSTWAATTYCYLEDLYVLPEARGAGIGRALIEAVRQQARTAQCGRFYWHTHHSNRQAQRLYDSLAENAGFLQYRMPL
jgi:GNAT superfamily N-acetyltransferase